MRAELSILRARSIFVNQGWEIVRLNSTKGWQNVNCRRTYSIARGDWGGGAEPQYVGNQQSAPSWVTVEVPQHAAWEVTTSRCLHHSLSLCKHTPSWPVKEKSQCCTGNTSSTHMMTEQDKQGKRHRFPHPTITCIWNKVRSSGEHILYGVGGFRCLLVLFWISNKREFKLLPILQDSGLHREDAWINVIHKLNIFV